MASKKPIHVSGDVLFIPLNKLKKSPNNVRQMPHTKAEIEALAASVAANGLLQNLIVEPEHDKKARATGYYLVTAGEGRRLAQLLRAKRKQITKAEPIRCVIDTEHSATEISLAENAIRADMHPADQYEAFAKLHLAHRSMETSENRGRWSKACGRHAVARWQRGGHREPSSPVRVFRP